MKSLGVLLLALGVVGCGAGAIGTTQPTSAKKLVVKNPFPTRDALEKIASGAPRPVPARDVATAPDWTVTVDGGDAKESKLEKSLGLLTAGASDDLTFTPDLRCAARELARFKSEHGATPDERIDRFITAACGRTANVHTFYSSSTVPAKVKEDDIYKAWKGKLKVPAEAHGKSAGAWMQRKGDKVTIAVAFADPAPVTVSAADDAGRVTVSGTVPMTSNRVLGLINQGAFAVAECENDTSVALPEFRMTCPLADGDRWAWLQVMTHPEGQRLMHTVSLSIARRDDQPITIEKPGHLADLPADPGAAILEGVNRTRAQAGLAPVDLAPKQSAMNAKVAPHFFGAELAHDNAMADELALGLLAGWDVDGGTIKNGSFFSGLISATKDPSGWLAYALEMPMGRHALLGPRARKIAIGPAAFDGSITAVVTTYDLLDQGAFDPTRDCARILDRINAERGKLGLAPLASLGVNPNVATLASQVHDGKREAGEALESALTFETHRLRRSVRGWALVTSDLDRLPIPPELLLPTARQISIEVTTFKPEGAPWAAYLIYAVTPAS